MSMHDDLTLPLDDSNPGAPGTPELRDQWGPFRLLARVGSGGFGEVYRAWDPNLEREVALKLLLPGVVGDEQEYNTMLREARAMASVQHPNIVHVYGIDRHDGRVGFWTDFVKGKTLSALLGEQGPFGYREAALIGIDVSRALSAVHRAGLLHRDIKAENVMREQGGRILLMDFGLSAGERNLGTQLAGTPNYMAPELFDGQKATVCTDIYAVGVLLYYLVIGEYPVRLSGLSVAEAKAALSRRTPLMDLRSDLPEAFLRTVRTAMELDSTKRFGSAGLLAESLAESLGTMQTMGSPGAYMPVNGPSMGTPTFGDAPTAAYTPTTAGFAPVPGYTTPPAGGYTPQTSGFGSASRPVTPPPPAPPALVVRNWGNAFGLVEYFLKLPKKRKWAVLGVSIFLVQKGCRTIFDDEDRHPARTPKTSVTAPAAPAAAKDHDPDNNEVYLKAADLLEKPYDEENVKQAMSGFQMVLKDDPDSALAQAGLGSAYYVQYSKTHDPKLLEMSKDATKKALSEDPNLAAPYANMARISAVEGHTELALQQAQKAVTLDPNSPDAYGALSKVYEIQGRKKEAITAVQKAIDLAPEDSMSPWVVRLGNLHYSQGDLKNASEQWQKGLMMDPKNVNAQFNLGLASMQMGKLDEAQDALQKAVKLQPNSAAALSALGSVMLQQGRYKEAITMNQKAVKLDPDDYRAWGNLGSAYQWGGGDHGKAIEAYTKAITIAEMARVKSPEDPTLLVELADYYASVGAGRASEPLLRKALARAPNDPHVTYRAGETYEILGQRANAIPLIAQALAMGYSEAEFERSPELQSLRGDLAFQAALARARGKTSRITVHATGPSGNSGFRIQIPDAPMPPKIKLPVIPPPPNIPN